MMTTVPPIPTPDDSQQTYDSIASLWIEVSCAWSMYQDLFCVSAGQIDFLNDVTPQFFALIQNMSIQHIVLGLCRLTDPRLQGSNENMSLGQLVELIPPSTSAEPGPSGEAIIPDVRAHIKDLVEAATHAATPLRALRNKRIAHLDASVEATLKSVWKVMDHFAHFWGSPRWLEDVIAPKDARGLVRRLRMAEDYEKLYQQGHIPAPRYLRTLSGDPNNPTALEVERLENLGIKLSTSNIMQDNEN